MDGMPDMRPIREDLQATIDARRDLGPDYETALVDSFVQRLDETIAARVRAELHGAAPAPHVPHGRPRATGGVLIPIVLGSLALSIPLTAIALVNGGVPAFILTWVAIVVINVAAAAAVMGRK